MTTQTIKATWLRAGDTIHSIDNHVMSEPFVVVSLRFFQGTYTGIDKKAWLIGYVHDGKVLEAVLLKRKTLVIERNEEV